MTSLRTLTICLALPCVLTAPMLGSELQLASTDAQLHGGAGATLTVQYEATFVHDGSFQDPTRTDTSVEWLKLGGIVPCVRLVLPAGCFVGSAIFRVEEFATCGATLTVDYDDGQGDLELPLTGLAAHIRTSGPESRLWELSVQMSATVWERESETLAIFGGSQVDTQLGGDVAVARPASVQSIARP